MSKNTYEGSINFDPKPILSGVVGVIFLIIGSFTEVERSKATITITGGLFMAYGVLYILSLPFDYYLMKKELRKATKIHRIPEELLKLGLIRMYTLTFSTKNRTYLEFINERGLSYDQFRKEIKNNKKYRNIYNNAFWKDSKVRKDRIVLCFTRVYSNEIAWMEEKMNLLSDFSTYVVDTSS